MRIQEFEKAILALVCWREDRSGGIDGMLAVASVIRNRVHAWKWTYSSVIEKKNQFSSMSVTGDSQTVEYPAPNDPLFAQVLTMVDGIYDNTTADITSNQQYPAGCLYYARIQNVAAGSWFDVNIVKKPELHPLVGNFGNQSYYL